MTRRTIDDQTRARVLSLVREGKGRNETAKLAQVSTGTVTNIMRAAGVDVPAADRARTERMTRAARDLDRARRLELLGQLADAVWERLEAGKLSPRELRDIAVASGILVQRSREERGEAVERHEHRHAVVHLFLPDDGRLPPEERARLLGQPVQMPAYIPPRVDEERID